MAVGIGLYSGSNTDGMQDIETGFWASPRFETRV